MYPLLLFYYSYLNWPSSRYPSTTSIILILIVIHLGIHVIAFITILLVGFHLDNPCYWFYYITLSWVSCSNWSWWWVHPNVSWIQQKKHNSNFSPSDSFSKHGGSADELFYEDRLLPITESLTIKSPHLKRNFNSTWSLMLMIHCGSITWSCVNSLDTLCIHYVIGESIWEGYQLV